MFPMNLHGSVADLAIVSAALAVLSLLFARPGGAAAAAAATTSLVKQVESGEAAEQIVCGAAIVVVVLAATKAAMLDWPSLGTGGTRQVSALTLVLDALLFLAAFYIRREQERRRYAPAEEAALGGFGKGDKEYKLLEEAAGGGRGGGSGAHGAMLDDDDPDAKRLSILQVLKTLKPYFWPRQTKGRVHVIMTWVFVCGSKATSVVAPLFIAKATNELSSGEMRRRCTRRVVRLAAALLQGAEGVPVARVPRGGAGGVHGPQPGHL